jgi:hypothetical protein
MAAIKLVAALYDFTGRTSDELTFRTGDSIQFIETVPDDSNWHKGKLIRTAEEGLYPVEYVKATTATTAAAASAPPLPLNKRPGATIHTAISPSYSPKTAPHDPNSVSIAFSKPGAGGSVGLSREYQENSMNKSFLPVVRGGLLASSMGKLAGYSAFVLGCVSLYWGSVKSDPIVNSVATTYIGLYGLILGLFALFYEYSMANKRVAQVFPLRSICYLIFSLPLFATYPTILAAVFGCCTGLAYFFSFIWEESYKIELWTDKSKEAKEAKSCGQKLRASSLNFWAIHRSHVPLFLIYIVANAVLIGVIFQQQKNQSDSAMAAAQALSDSENNLNYNLQLYVQNTVPSYWAAAARAFGHACSLSAAILLLPVCGIIIRWFYNNSTASHSAAAKFLRTILTIIPLDSALGFHKNLSRCLAVFAVIHTVSHLVNWSLRRGWAVHNLGVYAMISGGILALILFFILASSHNSLVRRYSYETFIIPHRVLMVMFYIFMVLHFHTGFSPNFWKYFVVPAALYIIELLSRKYRERRRVAVVSLTQMGEVFSLELSREHGVLKEQYFEGQYVLLNCPTVSTVQWHPFTLSSAPQDKYVTVHIKIVNGVNNSWTKQVFDYFQLLGPKQSYITFDRVNETTNSKKEGKLVGPDGKRLLIIDGPYSAPTQHLAEYLTVFIIGAGIGTTPLAACLKSVCFYRWRLGSGVVYPSNAYFTWILPYADVDGFRWLVRTIKECQDEVLHMKANNNMQGKVFTLNIYITSVPQHLEAVDQRLATDDVGFWGRPREAETVNRVKAEWSEWDLYSALKCPKADYINFTDIHIHKGRPEFISEIDYIHSAHPKEEVGVMVCGNKQIVNSLRKQCFRVNQLRQNKFKLHKENI